MLDDTIKCISMKSGVSSLYIEEEEEDEEEEEEDDEKNTEDQDSSAENVKLNDEEDEETQRRLASIERDNVMMNFAEYKVTHFYKFFF